MNTENFKSLSHASALELVGTLPDNSLALEQRIYFAQQTIRNTLVKLGHLRRPDHLLWAMHNHATYRPIGFAVETGWKMGSPTLRDITAEVRAGSITLTEDHYLRIAVLYNSGNQIGQAYIQLRYLHNDPISIAQMTRAACIQHENLERDLDRTMVQRELLQLERDRAAAERLHTTKVTALANKLETAQRRVTKKVRTPRIQVPAGV